MNDTLKHVISASLLLTMTVTASAQIEKLLPSEKAEIRQSIPATEAAVKPQALKELIANARKQSEKQLLNAARSARDFRDLPADAVAGHYAVAPMSDLQRLPDEYPVDGIPSGPVRILAAQDEYEPGSFVVYPFRDLGKVKLTMGELKTEDGRVFPAGQLDLKVIKVWYQNGNGWYSYFGDMGLKLTPELLLNDEDLVKVDTEKKQNYARLTEKDGSVSFQWITPYHLFNHRYEDHYRFPTPFACMKLNFCDADTLQEVTFRAGEYKQFFLTAHVTEKEQSGFYKGSIRMEKEGKVIGNIPVVLRVLPFRLPEPKTYFDIKRDFIVTEYNYSTFSMIAEENGGDFELAEKQFLAVMKNLKSHNQYYHWIREGQPGSYGYKREYELVKEAGLKTDRVFTLSCIHWNITNPLIQQREARICRAINEELFGHNNVYLGHGDEPGSNWVQSARPVFDAMQQEGFKFIIAGTDTVFFKAGYLYDFINLSQDPEAPRSVIKWNNVGKANVAWYAQQHVGPENPAFNRRQYGMAPYLTHFSALCNYAHHFSSYGDRKTGYRPMVFAYGQGKGVIDTLGWEGFREGVDDIRYATLIRQLAAEADKSPDVKVRHAGGQALQFLAELNPESADLNVTRLEMIRHIMKLNSLLGKGSAK